MQFPHHLMPPQYHQQQHQQQQHQQHQHQQHQQHQQQQQQNPCPSSTPHVIGAPVHHVQLLQTGGSRQQGGACPLVLPYMQMRPDCSMGPPMCYPPTAAYSYHHVSPSHHLPQAAPTAGTSYNPKSSTTTTPGTGGSGGKGGGGRSSEPGLKCYVGKIHSHVSEQFIITLLQECGVVRNWLRDKDPSTSKFASFGFCEYDGPAAVHMALNVLNGLALFDEPIMVKCGLPVREAVEKWNAERIKAKLKQQQTNTTGAATEQLTREQIEEEIDNEMKEVSDILASHVARFESTLKEEIEADEKRMNDFKMHKKLAKLDTDGEQKRKLEMLGIKNSENAYHKTESCVISTTTVDGGDGKSHKSKSGGDSRTTSSREEQPTDRNHSRDDMGRSRSNDSSRKLTATSTATSVNTTTVQQQQDGVGLISSSAVADTKAEYPTTQQQVACNNSTSAVSRAYRVHRRERNRLTKISEKQLHADREYNRMCTEWESYERKRKENGDREAEESETTERQKAELIALDLKGEWWEGLTRRRRREDRKRRRDRERVDDEVDREQEETKYIATVEITKLRRVEEERRTKDQQRIAEEQKQKIIPAADSVECKQQQSVLSPQLTTTPPEPTTTTAQQHESDEHRAATSGSSSGSSSSAQQQHLLLQQEQQQQQQQLLLLQQQHQQSVELLAVESCAPVVAGVNTGADNTAATVGSLALKKFGVGDVKKQMVLKPKKITSQQQTHKQMADMFGDGDEGGGLFSRQHRPLTKLEQPWDAVNKKVEADEQKRIKDKSKQLLSEVPTSKEELFAYPIQWNVIEADHVVKRSLKPWIHKKVTHYLGKGEDEGLVNDVTEFVVMKLTSRCCPAVLLAELEKFLDSEAESFVRNLWRLLLFEQMKSQQ
eukprot:GHVS01108521.1.p1 GENE.GHVS01108521.1~~GHVS01108521.1.p1  ORF type:complete len:887 (-),score=273.02 GHVS01108521.1:140-2800(-)